MMNRAGSLDLQSENRRMLMAIPRLVIYVCVGLILFLMPIYIDLEIKHVFNAAKELLFGKIMCVALVAWVIDLAFRGKIEIPKNRASLFFLFWISWLALSLLWSTSFSLSIREFGTQFGCFALFVIIITTVRSQKVIEFFVTCSIVSASIATVYGLFQYYDVDDKYFPIQQRAVQMQTPFGQITVQPGQSGISHLLGGGQSMAIFFHKLLLPQKPDETWKDYSFMGHRNYFSGYLTLIIPLVLVRLLRKLQILLPILFAAFGYREKKDKYSVNEKGFHPAWDTILMFFYMLNLLAMINAVILTQTRGAILGMTVSGCFLLLCSLLLCNQHQNSKVLMAVFGGLAVPIIPIVYMFMSKDQSVFGLIVVICALVFLGLLFAFRHIISRPILIITFLCIVGGVYEVMTDKAGEGGAIRGHIDTMDRIAGTAKWDGSAHQRTLIYSTTLRIITDNLPTLFFGKGHGTFGIHYMHYQVQLFLDTEVSGRFLWDTNKSIYAHNEYIHFWSETGLVGLSLLLIFWAFYITRVLQGIKRIHRYEYQENPMKLLTCMALLAGTIATLTHNVFAFDLHLMYSMVTFYSWIPCALILSGIRFHEYSFDSCRRTLMLLIVLFLGLSWYMAFGFSNFYMDQPAFRMIAFLLSGLTLGYAFWLILAAGNIEASGNKVRIRAAVVSAGCLLSFVLFLRFDDLYQSNYFWRSAFAKFSQKDWKGAFDDYQRALQRDSSLGELLFDFGRAMMDSNNNPRISKGEVDSFNISTIRRNLNYKTMYKTDSMPEAHKDIPDTEELRDQDLTNNFIAISAFLEATHNFTDPANFHNIALCFYKEGQSRNDPVLLKKSEEYYQKAIDLNPIYAQSLSNLGYIKALRGEIAEAKSMLERAEKLPDGQTATTFVGLALIYYQERDYPKTLEMYKRLEKINPGLESTVKIATLHKQMVMDELSLRSQNPSETTSSKLTDAELLEHMIQAEDAFIRASESSESDPNTKDRLLLEAMQIRIQRLRGPASDPGTAASALPELALAMVQMGSIRIEFQERDRYLQQGKGILLQVISQNPTNIEFRLALAKAYELSGEVDKLKEAYMNALRLMSPNHPEYSSIRRKLEMLK
ncbi:MAG: O-antigen ligase family protein [Candidatus Cloacimonetes bacterium]|nr:O-antigen ligase family protein [Candidatus Cloacimonadota bacterium]